MWGPISATYPLRNGLHEPYTSCLSISFIFVISFWLSTSPICGVGSLPQRWNYFIFHDVECAFSFTRTYVYLLMNAHPLLSLSNIIRGPIFDGFFLTKSGIVAQVSYIPWKEIKSSVVHNGFEFLGDVDKLNSCEQRAIS